MNLNWDLRELYENDADFELDFAKLKTLGDEIASYKSKLGDFDNLSKYLELNRELDKLLSKLYSYATLKADLDRRVVESNNREAKVANALRELISKTSYADPELLSLGKEYIDSFFKAHPEDRDFDFSFRKLFDGASHVLSEDKEKLDEITNEIMNNIIELTK